MKKLTLTAALLTLAAMVMTGCPKQTDSATSQSTKTATARPVRISDINLEAALRAEAGKSQGGLTDFDLARLSSLDLKGKSITSLAGLEYCTSLTSLEISGNPVRDLGPLSGLAHLKHLAAADAYIEDITPLGKLKALTYLDLAGNRICDLTPLAGLTNLQTLDLSRNRISEITPLLENAKAGGLGQGDRVVLTGNPLTNNAQLLDAPSLSTRGVLVEM